MALTPEKHLQTQRLFEAAIALPEAERAAFVRSAAEHDADVRAEVAALLEYDAGSSMESADAQLTHLPASILAEIVEHGVQLRQVGRYELLERIGMGGMGVVYRARQSNPDRTVALKVVRMSRARPSVVRRFRTEAESLARLRHPGIAQIYDAGAAATEWGELPYIAMELLNGRPLAEYVREAGLGVRERVELIALLCDAIEHAHKNGVMHRDLKPANIVVEEVDGRPQPKVLDFGVARLVEPRASAATLATETGQIVGTLAYMSPEQVAGDASLDTRTDVYALGVVAFEVLSGRLPLAVDGLTVYSAMRRIRDETPPRLGAIDPQLSGDLTTIVEKALAKDRDQRYGSAAALAEDLRRYLRDEPILAQPPSAIYLLRKFAVRNRALVLAGSAALLGLAIGAAALIYGLIAARTANAALEVQLDAERNSAAFMVRDIAENLNAVVGTAAVRRRLLEQLELQLANLVRQDRDDPEVIDSYARVLEFRGDLEQAERRDGLAEPLRRKCLELREGLVAAHPDVTAYQARLSIAIVKIGDVHRSRAENDKALAYYQRAFEIDQRLVALDPNSRWFLDNLAWSHDRIGHYWLEQGYPERAEALFLERLAINDRLLKIDPNNLTTLHGVATINGLLSDAAEKRRDAATVEARRAAAVDAARRLVAAAPRNSVYLETAHHSNRSLARLYEDRGEFAKAAALYDESIRLTELIAALDLTNVRSRQLHFDVLLERSRIARRLGDLAGAVDYAERAAHVADAPTPGLTDGWPRDHLRKLADAELSAARVARPEFEPPESLNP